MTSTETKEERKRTTTTKQNTSNSSNLVEDVTPQILSLGTKSFDIFTDALFQVDAFHKKWFNRFFPSSEMKLKLYSKLELNNNYVYCFGHKEIVDLFVCFALKWERTSAVLIVCQPVFRCASTVTRKFYPYVINT